jgi:hypothetical protein
MPVRSQSEGGRAPITAARVDHGSCRGFETCRQTLAALAERRERLILTTVFPVGLPHPHEVDNDRLPRLWAHRRTAGRNADSTVVDDTGPDWHGFTPELIRFFDLVG